MSRGKKVQEEKVQEALEQKAQEAVANAQEDVQEAPAKERKAQAKDTTMTLPQVYERALRGGKFRRKAWHKSVKNVFIRRGETKLVIGDEKVARPYQPSQDDAISKDWIEV